MSAATTAATPCWRRCGHFPRRCASCSSDATSIADAARRFAPSKRYWAVVGSGANKVAAEEVRIKLSELCYKSIACDVTEDKKHIDLSSEPLILVCAAGLAGSTADDVGKEVAIFRAHKATPIVIADEGDARYPATAVIPVPPVDPALGFVLSAMVGHLFGYEAALAIDASARPLRVAMEVIDRAIGDERSADAVLDRLRREVTPLAVQFTDGLRSHRYDGHLEASTAVHLAGLLRDVQSERPIEEYQAGTGKVGTPAALIDDLVLGLDTGDRGAHPAGRRHQAPGEDGDRRHLAQRRGCDGPGAGAGGARRRCRTRRAQLPHAEGARRPRPGGRRGHRVHPLRHRRRHHLGRRPRRVSRQIVSRVDRNPALVGTKRRVASEREVLVARGRSDGRTVVIVPEVKAGTPTGITLLQVRFHDRLAAPTMRSVLVGYDRRYDRLVDWVTETEAAFDDSLLGELPVDELLIEPISDAADHWRR